MMDAFAYARARAQATKGAFAWPPPPGQDLNAWSEAIRTEVARLIGAQDEPFPGPSFERFEEDEVDSIRRTRIRFPVREGLVAEGYLLTPKDPKGPGVLCLPGHGRGVEPMAGFGELDYLNRYAITAARHGWTVLALEMLSFGTRRSEPVPENPHESTCHRDSMAALMLGETMAGWRVRDARAALRVLESLPSVDPDRLAAVGISGGGTVALFTAIVDPKVSAVGVSGYFNTFFDSILSVHHCVDNYVPGILKLGEMPDLAAAIAPRRFFAESGILDPIFPLEAFRRACAQMQEVYAAHGHPDHFAFEVFENDHVFHGHGMFAQFDRWLGG